MATPGTIGLILQHEEAAPAALFADWCDRNGRRYDTCRVWEQPLPPDPSDHRWICSLGSEHSPGAPSAPPWVGEEVDFMRRALAADVPVLGLCFGAQALAAAAGAAVNPAEPAEIGWIEIETTDPGVVPPGPWAHFHYEQLELPAGADELARSPAGTAAFRLDGSLGVQFHPEATPEIVARWVRGDERRLLALGIEPARLLAAGAASAAAAAAAAEILFDRWGAQLETR